MLCPRHLRFHDSLFKVRELIFRYKADGFMLFWLYENEKLDQTLFIRDVYEIDGMIINLKKREELSMLNIANKRTN